MNMSVSKKNIFIYLFKKKLFPTSSTIFIALLSSFIYSWLEKGNYFDMLESVPIYVYLIFSIIFTLVLYYDFSNHNESLQNTKAASIYDPPYGYENIASLNYLGVKWLIQIPRKSDKEKVYDMYLMSAQNIRKSDINIDCNPICIKCNCEIIEKRTIFGKYKYICPNCNSIIKNKKSIIDNRNIVLKIARSKYN